MGNSPYSTLILIALMVVAFYFLIIRPNKKRQQAQQQTMRSLTPGTRVLLTSGLFGTIVEMGEKQAVLEVSPGAHVTVLKQAIARATKPEDEDTEWDPAEAEEPFDDIENSSTVQEDFGTDSRITGPLGGNSDAPSTAGPDYTTGPDYTSRPSTSGPDTSGPDTSNDPRSGTNTSPIKD